MTARLPRIRLNLRPAGAWRWLVVLLLVLLVVPLPTRQVLKPQARPAAYVARGSAAAIAVRYALDQLGKPYRWAAAGPTPTTAPA
jgi:hypothetical protein